MRNTFTKASGIVIYLWASLVAQMVKNLPAMQETWVLSLGQEHPLEKGMATHASILAWRIPWTEAPGNQSTVHGVAKSQTQSIDFHMDCIVIYSLKGVNNARLRVFLAYK